ncbi:hypothetical protein FACS1894132_08980 [Clostridia bacterium]|nr:hypothetical protein FACS1894132_08980 [Clostridia bacterium]
MNKTVTFDVDQQVIENCEKLFANLGMTVTEALKIFLYKSLIEDGIPFAVTDRVPNAKFQASIDESEAIVRGKLPESPAQSVEDFFKEMRASGEI